KQPRLRQACTLQRRLPLRDLAGVVVDTAVIQADAMRRQRVRQQADAATDVEQRRIAATQRGGDAAIQRIAAELAAHVPVQPAIGQEGAGNALAGAGIQGIGHADIIAVGVFSTQSAFASSWVTTSGETTWRQWRG